MNLIRLFQLLKASFVPQSDDDMMESRRALGKQIFQLSYFGRISAEYVSGLEISERNFMYDLLKEQLDSEKKANEKVAQKSSASTASMRNKMHNKR